MGEIIGTRFRVRLPPDKDYELGPQHAERFANALSRDTSHPLMTEWVEITKDREAGVRWITVVDRDMMEKVRPFVDSSRWTSIREPMLAGYKLDGSKCFLPLGQHGRIIGGTQNGKSSLIHSIIAHVTRCDDAVAWACGVQKLVNLVGDWVYPYEGTGLRLPLDWIASGPQDMAEMLAAAMRIGRARQSIPPHKRPKFPAIVLILDEARFALNHPLAWANLNGRRMSAAEIAQDIVTGITSAGVYLVIASQRDTNDQAGDFGGTTMAQMGYTAAFRISDKDSIGRMTGDYQLATPRYKGQYWLDAGDGNFPQQVKAPYMQESDTNVDRLHNGATIAQVALARQNFGVHLDGFSAQQAGEAYARRHTTMTPDFEAYLTGAEQSQDPITASGPNSPGPIDVNQEIRQAMADLASVGALTDEDRKLAQELGVALPDDGRQQTAVPSMVGRKTRKDRVRAIIQEFGPVGRGAIIEKLRTEGDAVASLDTQVDTILAGLVRSDGYHRDEHSLYRAL